MKTSDFHSPVAHFGVFELDLQSRELHKQGMKIRLQGQPVEILAMLLERPGEIVTREELQKRLWPADTFVDFEQGLNNAMKRLRAALDDDAESPHFIETLPRHGYRFIGAVSGAGQILAAEEKLPGAAGSILRVLAFGALVVVVAAAVLVGLNVHGWRDRLFVRTPKPKIQALAVLPLTNLSGDPEQEYFADGMTEALITELGKIATPRVISRQSVMQYKASKKPLREVVTELQVDAVLEGTVARIGDRVRITIHLSQAFPERQLWAQEYDRSIRDVLSLQGEIARAVADEVQGKLTSQQKTHLVNARPVNPEAYEDFLRGILNYRRWPLGIDQAISYFQKAIEKDPNYAPAYGWLARCYVISGFSDPPNEVYPKARAAAMKALEIDDAQADALGVLGSVKAAYDWDWPGAERELKRALELDPNNSDNRAGYVWDLTVVGRFEEAIGEAKRARALDPLSITTNRILGWAYMEARRYDEAIDQFKKTLELDPNYPAAHVYLAWCYTFKGMYPEALVQYQKVGTYVTPRLAGLGYLYAVMGKRSEALKVIEEMKLMAAKGYVDPFLLAVPYAGLGDRDNAMRLLAKAYEERSANMPFLRVAPFFDPLRADPRFQDLVRRMNFPP